ncbi:hypothetical protein PENANT_c002G04051 [Penicillium antarcticum]|uniref:Transcription factor domain-containing protein n=2 Tax=Penicillium antarcticum TaxID=416450 RepID=A0A1V6QKJ1_9EURO|nr:hypothetical protein PENANT_c002G04051 [Penicillium antarcticum]
MENHSELIELPIAPPADWNKPDLDFENQDLIPMPTADDIATRWTRPYLTMSTESAPKDLMPFTIDSIKRHLKFTISKLNSYVAPHYIHYGQLSSGIKEPLVKCFRLVRLLNHAKEDVHAIQREIHQEMKNIYDQGPQPGEMDRLCTFQVYLTYMIALYLSPFDIYAMSQHEEGEFESHVRLQEIACICARTGITSEAEESNTRPTWESWILTSAKRRTLFTMYLFTNIYNWKKGIPNYVAEELRGAFVPDGTALWRRHDRTAWEQEYNAHLLRWSDGKLAISELWRDAETGSATRRDRVDRWLEKADEFGRELFSICAQIHGY